jgi:site-specific DNA recombinase
VLGKDADRGYLLQGLTCYAKCGYAYYSKTIHNWGCPSNEGYRCSESDGYRFGGERICSNSQVQGIFLEMTVWREISSLQMNPERIELEHRERSMLGRCSTISRP